MSEFFEVISELFAHSLLAAAFLRQQMPAEIERLDGHGHESAVADPALVVHAHAAQPRAHGRCRRLRVHERYRRLRHVFMRRRGVELQIHVVS